MRETGKGGEMGKRNRERKKQEWGDGIWGEWGRGGNRVRGMD